MGYNGYTEKRKKSNEKYLAKFVKPTIRMTAEEKEIIEQGASDANKSFNRFVVDCAIDTASNGGGVSGLDVPDLAAYAKSAGMTQEEYIKIAIIEKMQRQDKEFKEDITRVKEIY